MDGQNDDFTGFLKVLEGKEGVKWPVNLVLPWNASASFMTPVYSCQWNSEFLLSMPPLPLKTSPQYSYTSVSPLRTLPITACPHTQKKHYAKNMCSTCYHKQGRGHFARSCPHKDKPLYARGKCQSCYLQQYHRTRVFGRRRRVPKSHTPCSASN